MLARNGAGPAPCVNRDEAGIDLGAGKRPLSSRPQANVQAILRAEYLGATTCTAAGVTARAISPLYRVAPPRHGLILGFSGFQPDAMAPAAVRLGEALAKLG